MIFGVSGILKLPTKTNLNKQELYPSNTQTNQTIPIAKIIYRMLAFGNASPTYSIAIIIHNDPNFISNEHRICQKDDEILGWERITNADPKIGLTYVCPITKEVIRKLGAYDNIDFVTSTLKLDLDSIPNFNKDHPKENLPIFIDEDDSGFDNMLYFHETLP